MADAFSPDDFDYGAFDEEAQTAEMRTEVITYSFNAGPPSVMMVVLGEVVFEGASAAMVMSAPTGSIAGSGSAEITPSDSAEMVLFAGGGTMSLKGGAFTGPNRPAGPVIIEYGGKFFSSDDRFAITRRRFQNKGDGKVLVTMERLRNAATSGIR